MMYKYTFVLTVNKSIFVVETKTGTDSYLMACYDQR